MKDGGYSPTRDALDRLYTYDALNRLLSATGRETAYVTMPGSTERLWDASPWDGDVTKAQGYKEEYEYDAVGFVKELKRRSYPSSGAQVHTRTYSGFVVAGVQQNHRLASASYDDGGHCVSEGVERKYEWDHAGRLRSFRNQATDATEPTQYVQYLYDASGQRVKKLNRKQFGSDWDVVVYIDGVLEQRTQQRGATTKQGVVLHVLDGGKRLGMRRTGETFDAKPENLLVLSDHLGSGSVELDWSLGDFIDREEFRPYGETSFGSYANKRYRFTGKERDEESGLNYHGARYYAPGLARWMSPDPKGLVDGSNLYQYVQSSPIGHSDPTGTKSEPETPKPNRHHDALTGTTKQHESSHVASTSKDSASALDKKEAKEFIGSSIYLTRDVINALKNFFSKTDREHITGKLIVDNIDHKVGEASNGLPLYILQVKIRHKSSVDHERFRMLTEIVSSKQRVVGTSPITLSSELTPHMDARIHRIARGELKTSEGRVRMDGLAYTLCSLDLQKKIYGPSLIHSLTTRQFSLDYTQANVDEEKFIEKPTYTSKHQDLSMLLFWNIGPNDVAHEMLGHLWLAIKEISYEHTAKLPGDGLSIDGKTHTRGYDFIRAVAREPF